MKYSKILLFTVFAAFTSTLWSQGAIPTKGKEFWVGFMNNYEVQLGQEELNLFITSDENTVGTVEIPGQGYSQAFNVVANQTTTVTLPNDIAEHFSNQVVEQRGIYVSTTDTVSVFAINFNSYTADGTKVLPINSLGTEYRVSSYHGILTYGSEFLIVATEDDSEIEITPSAATLGGDPAGVPFTVSLNRGESYQVKAADEDGDFMGTVIKGTEANGDCRPFAVFSGTSCVNVPTGCTACDHIYDQNFPVNTWGTNYYVVPWDFTSQYTYRILANEDNTQVQIDGGAPFNLNAGEWSEYNSVTNEHCITADKGISVTQYMEGTSCAGTGDPVMCILNDESQKIDDITFATVESTVINQHGLNIIINTADVGTLQLDGVVVDPAEFSPFPACPGHSFAQVPILAGSHKLEAPNGFTAYVYGTGSAESYAYSVGSFTPAPPIDIENVICSSDEVTLGIDPSLINTYWYAESDPDNILATGPELVLTPPILTDIYVGVGGQFQSGCEVEEYFSVEAPDPPALFSLEYIELCEFQQAEIFVEAQVNPGAYEYSWTPTTGLSDPNIANPILTASESMTYYCTVTTLTGCGGNIDSVQVEVTDGNITSFNPLSDVYSICTGEEAQFSLDIQESVFEDNFDPGISWGLWDEILNGSESDACGSAAGNALWFNGAGQRSAETVDIDVSTGGSVSFSLLIGSGSFPCDNADFGEDVVLEYSTNGGADWELIETFAENLFGAFTDVSVDIPELAETASTRFRWRQLTNSGNDQDNWSIDNVYVGITLTDDYDYAWSPDYELTGTDISDPIATPLETTTYYVTMTDQLTGCDYIDSLTIDVGQGFTLLMSPDEVLCDLEGVDISATPDIDGEYDWFWEGEGLNNPFVENPTASPDATTTYTVEVFSEQGCSAEGEVTITVNALLDLNVSATETSLCAGEETELSAVVDGTGNDLTYEWTPSESLEDPDASVTIATPLVDTVYEIVVTDDLSGCTLTDEIAIEVFDAFSIDAGEDEDLCFTVGHQLQATADTNDPLLYQWDNADVLDNAGIPSPTITEDGTFTFTVTATNPIGCQATDEVVITLLFDSFDLGDDIDACVGQTITLETGYGNDYIHDWSTNENTPTIDVTTTGVYSVTVESSEGCEDTDEIEVIFHALPVVDLGEDPGLCEGDNWTLDAQNAGADYEWSTTQGTQTIIVNETDTYSVIVTDEYGCEGTDDVFLEFHENPVLNLPDEHTMCEDEFLTLDAENPGSTYDWSNDEVTQTITVNTEGIYSVTVTNEHNCSTTDNTQLFIRTYPVVDLGPDQAYCESDVVVLDSQNPGLNNVWSNDSTTSVIEVTEAGLYSVTVDNGYCFTSDEINLIFNPLPIQTLVEDSMLCFDDPPYELILNAGNPGSTYAWNTGQTDQFISVNQPGLYAVEVTTAFGCSLVFHSIVEEFCVGDFLFLPNAFTPDNDGVNDVFRAEGTSVADFNMTIWNRWGDVVYATTDFTDHWDGSYNGGTHYTESEVYTYLVKYRYVKEMDGSLSEWQEKKGHVTVIR